MTNGQRAVATMLAVVAVMLGLNLIVRGSPTAVAAQVASAPMVPVPVWVVIVAAAFPVTVMTVWTWWSRRCRACGKHWALKETGQKTGGFFRGERSESKCKYCGQIVWRDDLGSEHPDRAEQTEQQPAAERCRCGYLLKGLTEKRCPDCGRLIPDKPRRKKPYLLWGFLIGFGIVALLTLLLVIVFTGGMPGFINYDPTTKSIDAIFLMLGLAIAVGTGLIGMLIGYGIYRWRCRIS